MTSGVRSSPGMAVGIVTSDDGPGLGGQVGIKPGQPFDDLTVELFIRQHPVERQGLGDTAMEKLDAQAQVFGVNVRAESLAQPAKTGFRRADRVIADGLAGTKRAAIVGDDGAAHGFGVQAAEAIGRYPVTAFQFQPQGHEFGLGGCCHALCCLGSRLQAGNYALTGPAITAA